eukprot:UN24747
MSTMDMSRALAQRSRRFKKTWTESNTYDWRFKTDDTIKKAESFESAKITGTNIVVLKDFFRLTREARPDEIRTKRTCQRALDLIKSKWKEENDYRWCENQLKSLRQDLKVQHIRDKLAVRTYETHARICLEVSDFSEYNQCQTALRSLYQENPDHSENKLEFTVY